jgi:hypothetical protein
MNPSTAKQQPDNPTPRDAPSSAKQQTDTEISPPSELQGNRREEQQERRELRATNEEENGGGGDHDQNAASSPFGMKAIFLIATALVLLLVLVGVILGLTGGGSGETITEAPSASTPVPVADPTPAPATDPTPAPVADPTLAPATSIPTRPPDEEPPNNSGLWRPKSSDGLTWQWQIQGTLDTSLIVDMYDVDLFDTSAETIQQLKDAGRIVVCYFSAGSYEGWRDDWEANFDFITGDTYSGGNAPFAGNMADWDERWLDIRRIDLLEPIMRGRLELAISKGCDAVEPDNMDAYTNGDETALDLTYADQLAYNIWLAGLAHELGISVGLKNDVDQLADLVEYFDWAINEQCFQYDECDGYTSSFVAQDKAVFGVEYSGQASNFCPDANSMGLSWLKKNLNLQAYREGCEDYL